MTPPPRTGTQKKLTCAEGEDPALAEGRAIYNAHCYFCHGYDGDAATVAARQLDPPPRDFTRAGDLDRARVLAALTRGRPGTAMKPFAGRLSPEEMEAVADFVLRRFVACRLPSADYHTPENGWPDPAARYGAAFPFATGEIAIDVDPELLAPEERAGLALFRSTCISCHEGRTHRSGAIGMLATSPSAAEGHDEGHVDEYDVPTEHDIPPSIPDLTEREARGRALYMAAYAECHAADGSGQNWIGRFLEPGPPDFTDPAFAARFDAAAFRDLTLDAPADRTMPSFRGVLTPEEVDAITAYVRRAFVERSRR